MKTPLMITFRDVQPVPSVEPEVRRRVDRLDRWTGDLLNCRVAVETEANRRRQGRVYRVKVSLRLPGQDMVAGEHLIDEDVHVALHGAFDALERQLLDRLCRGRGLVKVMRP